MRIAIPGSLPPANLAHDLGKLLLKYAPKLSFWLQFASALKLTDFDPIESGCTAFEAWQLKESGFIHDKKKKLSSGLGPLLLVDKKVSNNPVWLGEFGSLCVGNNRSRILFDPKKVNLQTNEAIDLVDSIRPLLKEFGFDIQYVCTRRCRLFFPKGFEIISESPSMIVEQNLDLLETQASQSSLWIHVLNYIQIVWHNHPFNKERMKRGLFPVNLVWPYGGGASWDNFSGLDPWIIFEELNQSFLDKDWDSWLVSSSQLDFSIEELYKRNHSFMQPIDLLLFGEKHQITLKIPAFHRYKWISRVFFPKYKRYWSSWWWAYHN